MLHRMRGGSFDKHNEYKTHNRILWTKRISWLNHVNDSGTILWSINLLCVFSKMTIISFCRSWEFVYRICLFLESENWNDFHMWMQSFYIAFKLILINLEIESDSRLNQNSIEDLFQYKSYLYNKTQYLCWWSLKSD